MNNLELNTDQQLIGRILKGDYALFELLVRRHNGALYKTGRAYQFNHQDTQDLMQESFIDAYTHLHQFENRASFKTWILRIMLHHCYRKKQKSGFKYEQPLAFTEKSIPMFSSQHNHTDRAVVNRELSHIIEQALLQLPLPYRVVFSLRELNGLNVLETAEVLRLTETNVKVRLNRAKQLLRKEIEKSYSTQEIFEFNLVYCEALTQRVMDKIGAIEPGNYSGE